MSREERPAELYRQFFLNAPIGCGISDLEGNLIDFNDALLAYSGWSREEMRAFTRVVDLYADGEKERDRLLGIARERGGINREEVLFKKKGGGTFPAIMSLRMAVVGDRRYWLATIEDAAEMRRAEADKDDLLEEMGRFTRMAVERELQMVELKKKIARLEGRSESEV